MWVCSGLKTPSDPLVRRCVQNHRRSLTAGGQGNPGLLGLCHSKPVAASPADRTPEPGETHPFAPDEPETWNSAK